MKKLTRTHRDKEYAISPAHPAAEAFPWLDEDELQSLADDIAKNGQQHSIVRLPDKRIVDGRNRELACLIANVAPKYTSEEMPDAEVVAMVISRNIHRRHLEPSQRAMIAASLANMGEGRSTASQEAVSQTDAARQMDVSRASVQRAASVAKNAPELVAPVTDGKLDVRTAEKVAKLPKSKRKRVAKAKDPKKAAKEVLKEQEDAIAALEQASEPEPQEDAGDAFVSLVETLCRDMDKISARIKELKANPRSYPIHLDSAASQVEAARKTLWQGRPCHKCPYCRGEGCPTCKSTGRVKKTTYDSGREAVGGD